MVDMVYIVRHGHRQDRINRKWDNTAIDPHDPPLSTIGIDMAEKTGRWLAGRGISVVWCSPFLRARMTAEFAAAHIGAKVAVDARLSEFLRARWFPDGRPRCIPETMKCPEDKYDTIHRAESLVADVLKLECRAIMLVGHGISVRRTAHALVGRQHIGGSFCGITQVEIGRGGNKLLLNNYTGHI